MKKTMMTGVVLATAALASAAPVMGKDRAAEPKSAFVVDLAACRGIADDPARLRCFDQVAARLQTAVDTNDVFVVDKKQIQATRRTLFGLPLPRLGIFSDATEDKATVDRIESVVRSASQGRDGNWTFALEDGSVWQQTDGVPLGLSPRRGSKATVKRAALGSYKLAVDTHSAVRVRRLS